MSNTSTLPLSHPALLIIDMQNGFCHPNGTFARLGMPVTNHLAIVPVITTLRLAAHAARIPVFFTRLALKPDYSNAGIQFDSLPAMKALNAFVEHTWDADILNELQPDPANANEIEVSKTRNTAFWQTRLQEELRARGVDQLLVAGVGTNVCVESTVRDAVTRDWWVKTVGDATATLLEEEHRASLNNLGWYGGVVTSQEVLEALEALRKRSGEGVGE